MHIQLMEGILACEPTWYLASYYEKHYMNGPVGRRPEASYADGDLSGPSVYQLGKIHRDVGRRRTFTVGVAITTPRVPLGLALALGVVRV